MSDKCIHGTLEIDPLRASRAGGDVIEIALQISCKDCGHMLHVVGTKCIEDQASLYVRMPATPEMKPLRLAGAKEIPT